ncbi:MAG: TetR/AcrR family transcriptional regulator [Myxococcales bacterium]|nr:TetR/AcrR family transcriptional regulator [Myxococcales bacterium]
MRRAGPRRTQGVLGGRSDEVVRRVLDAAIAEVARVGYAGLHMEAVAALADVHKTTLYRRWPSRGALIAAVVERLRGPQRDRPLPDTGRLEDDLLAAFALRATIAGATEGKAWARLLDERHTPELAPIVEAAVAGRRKEWRAMITRGIERGELPEGTDPELVLHFIRAIVDARPASASSAWRAAAVRTVVAGARAGTLVR